MCIFEQIVPQDPYPVETKADELLSRLVQSGPSSLSALFRGSQSRTELVAAFLALLELIRMRRIRLEEGKGGYAVRLASSLKKQKNITPNIENFS